MNLSNPTRLVKMVVIGDVLTCVSFLRKIVFLKQFNVILANPSLHLPHLLALFNHRFLDNELYNLVSKICAH